ncbi:hypothetical protein ACG0Z5_23645 [Scandinavium sp. M-37]|uniref:hypothetical protein n=1 Tax=Scandinavium sp. M-37 TaxID=3373077 RepID=UPI003744E365
MNQSDCSGKTPKLWPVFVDHFTLPHVENRIKTLYESIGMYYPRGINELILEFICEKGWRFNASELNFFLKSPEFIDIDGLDITFNKLRYNRRFRDAVLVFIFITIFFIGGSVVLFGLSKHDDGVAKVIFAGVGMAFYLIWIILVFGMSRETGRLEGAKRFYGSFSPWLKQKQKKLQQVEVQPAKEALTPVQVSLPSLFTRLGIWGRSKWKT